MKKSLLSFLGGVAACLLVAATAAHRYDVKKTTAEVQEYQGMAVFIDCRPARETVYLGTIKSGTNLAGGFQAARDKALKKARKEYPDAEGVIFQFSESEWSSDKIDVIKFK